MASPFVWSGNTGEIQTPDQVARQRRLADALMGPKPLATNAWEGLTQVGNALSGTAVQGRADEAEKAARAQASQAFSSLADGSGSNAEIIAALSNPWVASDPTQSTIAQALLQQNMKQADPAYALDLDLKRAQLAAANAPPVADPFTLGEGQIRYDGNGNVIAQGLGPAGPQTVVTNNLGGSNKFQETLDAKAAETFSSLMDSGAAAQVSGAKIGQLEQLLQNAPQGAQGALTSMAASLGLPVDGANEVQAAEALINQLVPQQRPQGSGTMSDADLALFKQSLPRIINQPGGNQLILQTMKAINDYTIKQGEIATAVATGQMSPAEGRNALYALPNPLAPAQQAPGAVTPPSTDGWQDMGNGVRIRPMGQ